MVWSVVLLTQKENQIFPQVKSKKINKKQKAAPISEDGFRPCNERQ